MTRKNISCILCLTGLMVAILSALEPHIPFIASLCGYFGDECQEARTYALFKIPIAWLGICQTPSSARSYCENPRFSSLEFYKRDPEPR